MHLQCDVRPSVVGEYNYLHYSSRGQFGRRWYPARRIRDPSSLPESFIRAKNVYSASQAPSSGIRPAPVMAIMEDYMV